MDLKNLDDMLAICAKYPRIIHIKVDNESIFVSFKGDKPEVEFKSSSIPFKSDMPPDDVMLFAATEDVDELMKEREA